MRKRNCVFFGMSLLVIAMLSVSDVHAENVGNNMQDDPQQNESVTIQDINDKVDITLFIPNSKEGERLQVSKGSNLDMYGIDFMTYYVEKSEIIQSHEYITNEMVTGFDSQTLGNQDVVISADGASTILPIEVIDGQAPGEVVSIKIANTESKYKKELVPLNVNLKEYQSQLAPYVELYDALGRRAVGSRSGVEAKLASVVDTSKTGSQNVTLIYKGLETTWSFEVIDVVIKVPSQTIPIGGSIPNYWVTGSRVQFVDKNNEKNIIFGCYLSDFNGNLPTAWMDSYDNNKFGTQSVALGVNLWGQDYKGSFQLSVGSPREASINDILSKEALNTMPKGEVVGAYDLPSGEVGAGTWVFKTGLSKGNYVDVWSYHDKNWLKIDTYTVDSEGTINVTFKADQLSPVLIVKSEKLTSSDVIENNKPNVDTSDNTSDTTIKQTSVPKTNDSENLISYFTSTVGSLIILIYIVTKKRIKNY